MRNFYSILATPLNLALILVLTVKLKVARQFAIKGHSSMVTMYVLALNKTLVNKDCSKGNECAPIGGKNSISTNRGI